MAEIRFRIKDYIQPFERTLALQELSALGGNQPKPVMASGTEFTIATKQKEELFASNLAYWETISSERKKLTSIQSLREATVNVVRNGIDLETLRETLPFKEIAPLPNRRCLRYGTHGIHEYRGKFFPQLVRSLINISGTEPNGIVADPMSGSGTTVVEAKLHGCRGIGLDMNPLSTFLSNVKCDLLSAEPSKLKAAYLQIRNKLLAPERRDGSHFQYLKMMPQGDQNYLRDWFNDDVLSGLDDIAMLIRAVKYQPARDLMWISLSNILRPVSWQKNDDLRVRKEVRLDVEIDPKKEFLEELARSIRAVLAFLYQEPQSKLPDHSLLAGDARSCAGVWRKYRGKVDVVITSPPYATALPYLDTDRLSLCYLQLLDRPSHRKLDQQMIGNREVGETLRKEYLVKFKNEKGALPAGVWNLIKKIESQNEGTGAGFRRRNLPALLAKYFFDMKEVLAGIHTLLKPKGFAYLIVGNNHTIAGGERVEIETAKLLAGIAKQLRFEIHPSISMEMLASRDIFRKNSMASEEILVLQKA